MISTRDGRTFCARFVILGPGPLSNPKIPDFEGRDTFEGHSFHSNAWDHDYDLAGKRVAVIGSGASAAQIIPAIAPEVGELHVFQRTPHWVLPRRDRKFSRLERALLKNRRVYGALRPTLLILHALSAATPAASPARQRPRAAIPRPSLRASYC